MSENVQNSKSQPTLDDARARWMAVAKALTTMLALFPVATVAQVTEAGLALVNALAAGDETKAEQAYEQNEAIEDTDPVAYALYCAVVAAVFGRAPDGTLGAERHGTWNPEFLTTARLGLTHARNVLTRASAEDTDAKTYRRATVRALVQVFPAHARAERVELMEAWVHMVRSAYTMMLPTKSSGAARTMALATLENAGEALIEGVPESIALHALSAVWFDVNAYNVDERVAKQHTGLYADMVARAEDALEDLAHVRTMLSGGDMLWTAVTMGDAAAQGGA